MYIIAKTLFNHVIQNTTIIFVPNLDVNLPVKKPEITLYFPSIIKEK